MESNYITFESFRAERREVIFGQVQVDQSLHAVEGTVLHLSDLAALQVEGHHLGDAGETVAGDVVEVVAAQVQEFSVGREALRNLGVTTVLTSGMVGLCLQRRTTENMYTRFAILLLICYFIR